MLRRTKAIIADQLPKKVDSVVFCDLTPLQVWGNVLPEVGQKAPASVLQQMRPYPRRLCCQRWPALMCPSYSLTAAPLLPARTGLPRPPAADEARVAVRLRQWTAAHQLLPPPVPEAAHGAGCALAPAALLQL